MMSSLSFFSPFFHGIKQENVAKLNCQINCMIVFLKYMQASRNIIYLLLNWYDTSNAL